MDTNPAVEVSPEAQLEAAFQRQEDALKAPREPDPEAEEVEEAPEAEPEAKAEEPEVEGEEIEVDGEKYVVPPKLKEAFLKSKDYTQKTQAVAEQRKELEARQQALQQTEQLQSARFQKAVEIQAIDQQLAAYKNIDWQALVDSDPTQAVKLDIAHRRLQEQKAAAVQDLQQVDSHHKQLTAQQRQEALQRDAEVLSRDIKGWGPELGRKIAETGKGYGYTEAELANVTARDIKVLHDAHLYRELVASKAVIQKKVLDAKPVTVKSARSAPQTQSAQSVDDAKARQRRTGTRADTEAYLEKLFSTKRK